MVEFRLYFWPVKLSFRDFYEIFEYIKEFLGIFMGVGCLKPGGGPKISDFCLYEGGGLV